MHLYKRLILWICGIFLTLNFIPLTHASKRAQDPIHLMDNFAHGVNTGTKIHSTALNDFNPAQWSYAREYRITNAFDEMRKQIAPYLQWIMFLGLSIAVIAIIYNGFLMVTKPLGNDGGDAGAVKQRIINIAIGICLLTGFYVIIQMILAIISYLIQ